MAGNWPDYPGMRAALHVDGTSVLWQTTGGVNTVGSTDLAKLNSFVVNGTAPIQMGSYLTGKMWCIFPTVRDLKGYFMAAQRTNIFGTPPTMNVYTSPDTTNGLDGTWTSRESAVSVPYDGLSSMQGVFRSNIHSLTASGIKGIRFDFTFGGGTGNNCYVQNFHVYADLLAATASDRLQIWDPSSDIPAAAALLDFGNRPRSSTATKTFRVKNLSSTLTANSVVVDEGHVSGDETTSGPGINTMYTFSTDNVTYSSSATVGTLAPGAISGVVYVKCVTPADGALGVWDPYVRAVAGSWT
jgi:hypothetical protein